MNKPTCKQIWDEELGWPVHESDDMIRHGVYHEEVYHRKEDDTYWYVGYRIENDGDFNELRDGTASDPVQVYPKEVMTVVYERVR